MPFKDVIASTANITNATTNQNKLTPRETEQKMIKQYSKRSISSKSSPRDFQASRIFRDNSKKSKSPLELRDMKPIAESSGLISNKQNTSMPQKDGFGSMANFANLNTSSHFNQPSPRETVNNSDYQKADKDISRGRKHRS